MPQFSRGNNDFLTQALAAFAQSALPGGGFRPRGRRRPGTGFGLGGGFGGGGNLSQRLLAQPTQLGRGGPAPALGGGGFGFGGVPRTNLRPQPSFGLGPTGTVNTGIGSGTFGQAPRRVRALRARRPQRRRLRTIGG